MVCNFGTFSKDPYGGGIMLVWMCGCVVCVARLYVHRSCAVLFGRIWTRFAGSFLDLRKRGVKGGLQKKVHAPQGFAHVLVTSSFVWIFAFFFYAQ